ncbi:MAG: hypothetical protein Q4C34_05510 [Bacteroidales bacterium]|nr:hypothetical protein [Bacteroidales bacterium]
MAATKHKYQFAVADGDKIEVAVFDPAQSVSDIELTLEFPEGCEGCLKNIRDWTKSKFIQDQIVDGKLTVAPGTDLQFNLNSTDYDINSVEYNGVAQTIKSSNFVRFIADKSGTVKFDVSAKDFGTRTFTAYVVNPEGVSIIAGNGLNGVELPLTGGETVNEEIVLDKVVESGNEVDGAYTIPAGAARKFTLTHSLRYNGIMVLEKDGYYIAHTRQEDRKSTVESGCTSDVVYIVAQSTAPDSKAWIYYVGPEDRVSVVSGGAHGASRRVYLKNGYNEYDFNLEYETPVALKNGEEIANMSVELDGDILAKDDNGVFSNIPLKDGSVMHVFADGKTYARSNVNFNLTGEAAADVTYDKVLRHDIKSGALAVYPGTEVVITPAEGTSVAVDGDPVELDGNGSYVLTTTGAHAVNLTKAASVYKGAYTLNPESGTTAESLEIITLAFPDAATALCNEASVDEMMLVSGNNYAAWRFDVETVEGAPCPTFNIRPQMTPNVDGDYSFYIPEGVFTVDGDANSEIRATFSLIQSGGDIEYAFDPVGDIFAGEWYTFAIIFNEGKSVSASDDFAAKTVFKFNDQVMTCDVDYMALGEGNNMFMFMISNEALFNIEGTISLEMAEGALLVSGQPSPAISNTWNVVTPIEYTVRYLTDPAVNQSSLAMIKIAFPEAKTAEVFNQSVISLRSNDYSYNRTASSVEKIPGSEYPAFEIMFDPAPTADGPYKLTIGWTAFTLDGSHNLSSNVEQEFVLDKTSGIGSVSVDPNAPEGIYNLQGIRLDTEWSDLPAGLYIRDGKKVSKH